MDKGSTAMDKPEYIQTLVQVAILYYENNLTQQEIAEKLGTTRQSISKLLYEAKNAGIVEIKINNPLYNVKTLSQQLVETFKMENALVVPGDFTDEALMRNIIAQKGIGYINELFDKGYKKIGLSWGKSVYTLIQFLTAEEKKPELEIFPLIGAGRNTEPQFMINEMVRLFSHKTSGTPYFIYLPVNPGSAEEYELYAKTRYYKDICMMWDNIDIGIVGIGSIPAIGYAKKDIYPGEYEVFNAIEKTSIIGDVCTHYFDASGKIIQLEETSNFIRIPEKSMRKAKKIVALACGLDKAAAIKGALLTGLISDIIMDEKTAKEVLKGF